MRRPLRPLRRFRQFLDHEAAGGLILIGASVLAVVIANSASADAYFAALHTKIGGLSVLHWINDALMALFFLLVGLEIKREMIAGELSTWPSRALPGVAALGGMAAPAGLYVFFNAGLDESMRGWAVPTATDIAFALGVLSLLGSRVPASLKVFLAALAIIDDLGAVLIIAFVYTSDLDLPALAGAGLVTLLLAGLNRSGVRALAPYLLLGVALWALVFLSGVHATVAGVVLALAIPLRNPDRDLQPNAPLQRLEHALSRPVNFLVVPLFGFANAGLSFAGLTAERLLDPVPLGVALGLFVGKQAGVFLASFVTIRLGLAQRPAGAGWGQFYGVALLCGIGFTMSLFVGLLAFPASPLLQDEVKLGVIAGSLASAAMGALVLLLSGRRREPSGTIAERSGGRA